ncbi:MAG TPA: hypothetical protein VH372_24620 [Actinospica sp.]|jgi:hypothetical protein|nr:hypothetical protein [Actinospica sp.]
MTGKIPRVRRSDRRTLLAGPAAALLLAGALAACSSGNSSPSSSTTSSPANSSGAFDTASASSAVKQTWTTFFSKSTPIAQKETLLQDGTTTYAPAVQAFASNPMVGEVTANVQSVTFPSPTQADVTYSISLGGQVVENSMAGKAVYQNGKWLVADTTLCGLLQLAESQTGSAASIPGCG